VDRRGPAAQEQRVVRDEQVHGAAHHQEPHQRAVLQPGRDGVRVEVLDPGGQGEVRRQVLLGLEPDEVPDHLVRGRGGARQQVLAVQERAVQAPAAEDHGREARE
jgi:hypothetical protein